MQSPSSKTKKAFLSVLLFCLSCLLLPVGLHSQSASTPLDWSIESLETVLKQIDDLERSIESLSLEKQNLLSQIQSSKQTLEQQKQQLQKLDQLLTEYQTEVDRLKQQYAKLLLHSQKFETLSLGLGISSAVLAIALVISLVAR